MLPFRFAGQRFILTASNALYWPARGALLVADLHFEKGSSYAQRGQFLPPYDTLETLDRLKAAIAQTGARQVIALGDNFHDDRGAQRLSAPARDALAALMERVSFAWIEGNHDRPAPQRVPQRGVNPCASAQIETPGIGSIALRARDALEIDGIVLRHEAQADETRAEISGHFHPQLRLRLRGRAIRRPAAVLGWSQTGPTRLILPAFGSFTGGMDARDPAIRQALAPVERIDALVANRTSGVRLPIWSAATRSEP